MDNWKNVTLFHFPNVANGYPPVRSICGIECVAISRVHIFDLCYNVFICMRITWDSDAFFLDKLFPIYTSIFEPVHCDLADKLDALYSRYNEVNVLGWFMEESVRSLSLYKTFRKGAFD